MTGRASTSSSFQYHFTYDVFLNFRGEDTRHGFTGSLYHALTQKGVYTFFDDEEIRKGNKITPTLLQAIEESRIVICVFSKNYAFSRYCLDELILICQNMKEKGQLVFPIFYDVDPSEVRRQKGNYGQAMTMHEHNLRTCEERIQMWKVALFEVANLSGICLDPRHDYEYEIIEVIVKEILCRINKVPLHVAEYPIGLDNHMDELYSLLQRGTNDQAIMVGIYGIGGIGKTTLARKLYNSIAHSFEGLCFLHDIKENSRKYGLERMQERMLSKILGVDIKIDDVNEGVAIIKERFRRKTILLILDNVDEQEQLQKFAGHCGWFGSGSIIIITTRDKHLLKRHGVERTYEMEARTDEESLQLLIWNAFKNTQVGPSYNEVMDRVIPYAHGLLLAKTEPEPPISKEQPMLKKRRLVEDNHIISDSIGVDQETEEETHVSSKKDFHGNTLLLQEIEYESQKQTIDIQSPSTENEESVRVRRPSKNMTHQQDEASINDQITESFENVISGRGKDMVLYKNDPINGNNITKKPYSHDLHYN
ncbi:TMV resistance protein N-like isoform X2 [Prosopis cineraria]|uniref:TMV resistance protein N-like isoform X2 n=1 Tax=Prosopis cineraria TaxID=364024 RepID=UPI00240F9BF0|nr:TMV resistance protein N-like isoform X2 [Prosopis cineraria]